MRRSVLVLSLALLGIPGCSRKQAPTVPQPSTPGTHANARAFGEAAPALMKALTEPTEALHFSYQATAQVNPKYPHTAGEKPELGPVSMEADVRPDSVAFTAVRGTKTDKVSAKKDNELAWSMAKLPLMGPMMNVGMYLAFAAPAARSADGVAWTFDSRALGATEKAGMALAQSMLRGKVKVEQIYGALTVDAANGRLATFQFDVELKDEAGQTWKEHHSGKAFRN